MPFPESQRVIFARNPLQEVICQLRYPTVLQINQQGLPAFQERIRDRYPLFEEEVTGIPEDVARILKQLSVPPSPVPTYNFINESETKKLSICRDFIALSDVAYERWEDFREEMLSAQEALEETFSPSFYSRVGLRYLDVVDRRELGIPDTEWSELFRAELVGVLAAKDISEGIVAARGEAKLQLPLETKSSVIIRYGLVRIQDANQEERHVYTIDSDFFTEEKVGGRAVSGVLDRFNKLAGNLFRWAILPTLEHVLSPNSLQ